MTEKTISKRKSHSPSRSPLTGFFPHNFFSRSLFDDLFDQYLSDPNRDHSQIMNVSMDVVETEQAYEVKVDLPGINTEDVDIQIDNNTLTIRGRRCDETEEQDDERQFHRIERFSGSFSRSIVLPSTVNEDETAAEFKDGVLKIVVPKTEDAKPKKINISR